MSTVSGRELRGTLYPMPFNLLTASMKSAILAYAAFALGLTGCHSLSNDKPAGKLQPVARKVNLKRFMGAS